MHKIIICITYFLLFTLINDSCYSQTTSNVFREGDLDANNLYSKSINFIEEIDAYLIYKKLQTFKLNMKSINYRSIFKMKLDSSYTMRLSDNGFDLELSSKLEFIFNEEKRNEIVLHYDRNIENITWQPRNYNVFHYNKNDLITRHTFNLWNGDNNLDESSPNIIRNIEYNDINMPSKYEGQNLSAIQANRITNRILYEYDSLNNLSKTLNYQWNTTEDSLLLNLETDYIHNEQNQLKEIVSKDFSPEDGWQRKDSTIFSYDNNNIVIKKDRYSRTTGGGLKFRSSIEYIFSINDQLQSEIEHSRIDDETNEWQDIFIKEYDYDNLGNIILLSEYYSSNIELNTRELLSKQRYKHLSDYKSTDVLSLRENIFGFTAFITDNSIYNPILEYEFIITGEYAEFIDERTKYFYSDFSTSTTNVEKHLSLKISPNPVVDILRFDLGDYSGILNVTLWNTQGKLMTRKQVRTEAELSVSQLRAGVYLYTAKAGDKVFSGQFIKL